MADQKSRRAEKRDLRTLLPGVSTSWPTGAAAATLMLFASPALAAVNWTGAKAHKATIPSISARTATTMCQ